MPRGGGIGASLEDLAGVSVAGFLAYQGSDTWASRTLTPTTNQTAVTNGAGGGDPVLSNPQDLATTSAVQFGSLGLGGAASVTLHVVDGGTPGTPTPTADTVAIVQNSAATADDAILAIVAGNTGLSMVEFGRANLSAAGAVTYDHNGNALTLSTSAAEALRIDNTQQVGVNTTAPCSPLDVARAGGSANVTVKNIGAIANGNVLGRYRFAGSDDFGEGTPGIGAEMLAVARADWTAASSPGQLLFKTTPTGATGLITRMSIDQDGTISCEDNALTNISSMAIDTITSDGSDITIGGTPNIVITDDTTIAVTLGTDAGDDFTIGTTMFVVEGDSGAVTIGALTAGSVVFSGASGLISQDNTNLFWDDTLDRLGIGINTGMDPNPGLTVVGDVDISHTAASAGEHAIDLDIDAAGFGGVNAIEMNYMTGALAAGDDESALLINVNQQTATGGTVYGTEVLATAGSATVYGLAAGVGVAPVRQATGSFGNMDYARFTTSGGGEVDCLTAFTSLGTDVTLFTALNDYVIIGDAGQFTELEFLLATDASGVGIKPTFAFSTGGSGFTPFVPSDGTRGMRNSGVIAWLLSAISGTWATNTSGYYEIKITRTATSLTTPPIEDLVQIAIVTEYSWSAAGAISAKNFTSADLTASRLMASDGNKKLVSADLFAWVAGTASEVAVADDGDGSITLSIPATFTLGTTPSIAATEGTTIAVTLGNDGGDDFTVDSTAFVVEGDTGFVGMGTATPANNVHVSAADPIAWLENTDSGDTSPTRTTSGIQLSAGTMDGSLRYTPAIKFMSTDANFTTENPKLLAFVAGRANEAYDTDTKGGMHLDFASTPATPGATTTPTVRFTVSADGRSDFWENDIINVGDISLDSITSDGATITIGGTPSIVLTDNTAIAVTLGNDAGDDFTVDSTSLVVEGDTGDVGVGIAPTSRLHVYETLNGDLVANIQNPNVGNAARSIMRLSNDASSAAVQYYSAAHTTQARNLQVINNDAAGDIRFYFNGADNMILRHDGNIGMTGNLGIGVAVALSRLHLGLATEDLEVVDAGSAAATQQDWIEVEVAGVQGYVHVYAAK